MTDTRAYSRIDPRKARAWSSSLKPNSVLRHEPAAHVAAMRALLLLAAKGRRAATYGELAAITGFSWRAMQGAVKWARSVRLIHTTKLGGGQGMVYVLLPQLAANFLGCKPVQKRARDAHSNSHHRRGDKSPQVPPRAERDAAPRRSAAPTPPTPRPDSTGRGATADATAWVTQPGRERAASEVPAKSPARSAPSAPERRGASQRSTPAPAGYTELTRTEQVEWLRRALSTIKSTADPPGVKPRPPTRRRVIVHPDQLPKKSE